MMTSLSSNAVWLLTGLDAVLLAVLGTILFMYMRRKRRDTAGLSELIRTIKENEPGQLETLRTALKEQYGQSDDDAAENSKRLAKVRKTFYKHLINVHLARDGEAFASLDPRLDELLMAYRTLMPIAVEQSEQPVQEQAPAQDSTADTAPVIDLSADLEELKRQNEELKQELQQAKRSLDEALNEYASAYSGGAEAGKERLEHERHKLQDQKEHRGHAETTAPPAPEPETAQDSPEEEQPGAAVDTAAGDVTPDAAAQEPTAAPGETAQNPPQAQSQDDIDLLMDGMPNLDGILVEEAEDANATAAAAAPAAEDSEPQEQAVEKEAQ